MKFSKVHVVSGNSPPVFSLRETDLVIWFETDDKVWLDWLAGDGSWIPWLKGTSIRESLLDETNG